MKTRHIRIVLGFAVLFTVLGARLHNTDVATISYLPITAQAATGTGWQEINGTWYYFNTDGAMLTGWQEINGIWYYFNPDGAMRTGWLEINGTWYWFDHRGHMLTGWQEINGTWYYFNPDGAMQDNGRVVNQRQFQYTHNRGIIDGEFYWPSSRAREWLHSTSTNPQFTNKGLVTRRTRGFLSGFTQAEIDQIAITRRKTPTNHNAGNTWVGLASGLTSAERIGSVPLTGNDGLIVMWTYSLRYQGDTYGDPMSTDSASNGGYDHWESTITYDKVFIPTAWELQRYVESRGWSLAIGNTTGGTDISPGYWVGGTQSYTYNFYRGIIVSESGRVNHGSMWNTSARGIVPMLHLKPNAAAGQNKKIGDIITFGRYDSDNAEGHRGAIQWRIVNETPDGHKLIMAEQAVDHFNYNVAPSGDPNNAAYTKSNYVNFNTYDVDIVNDLLFQNTDASGTKTTRGNPLQPWFRVVNTSEFHRRNTSGARFQIQGRSPSGSSPDTLWVGGNFVRGSTTIEYRSSVNDPSGAHTPITIKNNLNIYMIGHLPYNMIDAPVNLDVKYDLPYNGYASNNQYVDIDVGLSNWDVNHVIPYWKQPLWGIGDAPGFMPPDHTTYAGTRYRMSGRMRVTDWRDMHTALSASEWDTLGFAHRTYSTILTQPRYLHDMYLTGASFNQSVSHGYDDSVGPVDPWLVIPWARLRDAPGDGWVDFSTVMPTPNTWLNYIDGIGLAAYPNVTTRNAQWPEIEIENWKFELIDDEKFKLQSLTLPNGQIINNPPVGSMARHRVTSTGNYSFTARDTRGYDWNATANIKIDKTVPTGSITANTTSPTNGNITLTLDSRDDETGLSKVEYISGGKIQSSNIPSINQSNYVQTHRSTFVVSENGTYRFRLTDRAGNIREVTHTVGNIDRTPPTTSVSQTPTAWTNQNVAVSWTANAQGLADLRRVRFHDGSGWSAWTNTSGRTQTFNRTITGNTTVYFEVEDVAGNVASRTHTVSNIDKDLPEMTFSHSPSTWTNTNVTTTIRARDHGANGRISGLNRMRIRSHSGTWGSWINYPSNTELSYEWFNHTHTITANGGYDVQIEDRAGNQRTQGFTVDWIDRTPPTVTSSQSPTGWTNGDVTITWNGTTEGSPIRRSRLYNGSEWGAWTTHNTASTTSTQSVTANGTYRIQVEDQAGNVREATHTVGNIDKTVPNMETSLLDTGWTNGSVRIRTRVSDRGDTGEAQHISGVNRIRTRIQGGTWSAWRTFASSSEKSSLNIDETWSVTSNGTYEWQLEDRAGNIRTSAQTVSNIDTGLPTGSVTRQTGWTNGNVWIDVTGQDTSSGLASIKYVSGGAITGSASFAFTGTTSSQTVRFTATQNGTYTFDITDRAGNVRRVTQVVDNIDRTVPQGAVTQTPTVWTNQNVTLQLTGGDLNSQGTRISGVDRVRMRPVGATSWTETRTISDSTEASPNFATQSFTVTSNGRYQFELRDRAGNIRMVEHTVGNIDKAVPNMAATSLDTNWTNGSVRIRTRVSDKGDTSEAQHISGVNRIRMRTQGGTWGAWRTFATTTQRTPDNFDEIWTISVDGTYEWQLEDRAGNVRSVTHTVSNIDTGLPSGSATHMSGWTNGNVWIDVTGQDTSSGLASIKYVSGGAITGSSSFAFTGTTSSQTVRFTATQNGTYSFDVVDSAGNVRRVTRTVDNIDRTAPTATTRLSPNTWTNQNVNILIKGSDSNNQGTRISGVDRVRMRRAGSSTWLDTQAVTDSTESSPTFAERTFTVTENGVYEFEVRDRAGNTSIVRQTVDNINRTPPEASGTFTPNGWTNQNITITWVGERKGNPSSPLRRYRTHNGTSWSAWQNASNPDRISVNQVVSSNGMYRFEVQDEAGNIAASHVVVSQYDNVAPTGNIRARYDRTEQEMYDGSLTNVNMVDQRRVTVDVFDVEDLGISGVEFVEVEEQRRIGRISSVSGSSIDNWQTVNTYRYNWPDHYNVSSQTYHIDAAHALDTRFVLVVQDRAGNRSTRATSNPVRQSVLQLKGFNVVDVVNPSLSQSELDDLRNIDFSAGTAPLTAGTNVTIELTYQLRHLDTVKRITGKIKAITLDPSDVPIHTTEMQIDDEPKTGHNRDRVVQRTFTVPEGAPRGSTIRIEGNLKVELENGSSHEITYPDNDRIGSVDNHLEEFFRFRIVR